MVANLTEGKKAGRKNKGLLQHAAHQAQELKDLLLRTVQEDADAFDRVLACFKLPKGGERAKAIVDAQKGATLVPFSVLERVAQLLDLIELMEQHGLASALSDVGVAALNARAAAKGAYFNILINLKGIEEREFTDDIGKRADELVCAIEERATHLEEEIQKKLRG
jgi:formiminotetrahydrofolate cyclodeaminase